jgi:preprotein translocase subunit SecB
MEKAKNSLLSFSGFKIVHSSIDLNGPIGQNMNFGLDASGEINKSTEVFHLKLKIEVKDDLDGLLIKVDSFADFKIVDGSIDDPAFNNYLFLNAPAILFPYIRAYITALTALSGAAPITIPPLNTEGIKEILKKQTQIIEKPAN